MKFTKLSCDRFRVEKASGLAVGTVERDPATGKWLGFALNGQPAIPRKVRRDVGQELIAMDTRRFQAD